MKAISVGNARRWDPEVHAGDWMRFRTSNNKFSAWPVEKAIWEFEDRYVLECHDGQEGLQILVKTLKGPTVELVADRRKKMCSLKLLSGSCIGSLPISEHEKFTSLRVGQEVSSVRAGNTLTRSVTVQLFLALGGA